MKKILAILALAVSGSAFAANFVQVEQENVIGRKGADDSVVSYVRAGKDIGAYSVGVQSRTARFSAGGIASSLEGTVSNKTVSAYGITPFVGAGRDFGGDASKPAYSYGLIGATTGLQVGPGFALAGVKTRVGSTQDGARTKQTVGFASYNVPVAKDLTASVGVSRSGQDIKEKGVSVGLAFGF
jgi:hypothetical protein